ncbi:hypothetical protein HERIO_1727 [Hepatospora eriocheir]|uniref:Uncharacterized protein n=2 Tax=Hepatospora eriocheir TaxID=1081669 RepID=A0A1X0Q9A3_9MICR|nr:hypothetical protein HERIO_1727 [Hepatospora eriocheir]
MTQNTSYFYTSTTFNTLKSSSSTYVNTSFSSTEIESLIIESSLTDGELIVNESLKLNLIRENISDEFLCYFITVTQKRSNRHYFGYDSSAFCIILTNDELEINERYSIYGKVRFKGVYFIESYYIEKIDYKEKLFLYFK